MWKMEYELRRFLYFKLKLQIKGIRISRVIVKGFLAVPKWTGHNLLFKWLYLDHRALRQWNQKLPAGDCRQDGGWCFNISCGNKI